MQNTWLQEQHADVANSFWLWEFDGRQWISSGLVQKQLGLDSHTGESTIMVLEEIGDEEALMIMYIII